jgi:hypothetical protein
VEFAVRYAQDHSWTTKSLLDNLDNMTRNLGRGKFTLDYDSVNDKLTSTGEVTNASKRIIVVSSFTSFLATQSQLIIDPASPAPCQQYSNSQVWFYIKNIGSTSVTLHAFSATWLGDVQPPVWNAIYYVFFQMAYVLYQSNGPPMYYSGYSPYDFNSTLTYTMTAGQVLQTNLIWPANQINLRNMIFTFYDTSGNRYDFDLDPGQDGIPAC